MAKPVKFAPIGVLVILLVAGVGGIASCRPLDGSATRVTTESPLAEYVCERNHAAADFDPSLLKSVDLRMTVMWSAYQPEGWEIKSPPDLAGKAVSFQVKTGSVGGSQGIQWKGADGKDRTAFLSFTDIAGDGTIWMELAENSVRTYAGYNSPNYAKYTCGPAGRHPKH